MLRRTALLLLLGATCETEAEPLVTPSDNEFLDDLCHRAVRYYVEQADPHTGLVFDRTRADGSRVAGASRNVASISATGFGLTALSIGVSRGWIERADAVTRARTALRFFAHDAVHEHGWFFHFLDAESGQRVWQCELSSIDTALLLAGALAARKALGDGEISQLVQSIWERLDFGWMRNGDPLLLAHGWKPESGFLPGRWDRYSELPILYLLGIGSPGHPLPPQSWYAWKRPRFSYYGFSYVGDGSLFTHQYPQAWLDLRGLRDRPPSNLDYFDNSMKATRAHRAFCIDMSRRFPKSYSKDIWGVTASDSAKGYLGWGGPPADRAIDGTLVPCAPGGSLMFAPDICLPALRAMRERFGDKIYDRYGFCDAFNPATGWTGPDVLGIDAGITLLSAENLRGGTVWRWFMQNIEIRDALKLAGFHGTGARG
jgi:hypothetical protein